MAVEIEVENHGESVGCISNPHGTFYITVPAGETIRKAIPVKQLRNMANSVMEAETMELEDSSPRFTITFFLDDTEVDYEDAVGGSRGKGIIVPLLDSDSA